LVAIKRPIAKKVIINETICGILEADFYPEQFPDSPSLVKDLRPVREGSRNEHTAIGLAPRSSRFQKPEGVASKFARSPMLRTAAR
jgi:hypothetical protein